MESDFVYNKRYFFQKMKIVMCFVSKKKKKLIHELRFIQLISFHELAKKTYSLV